MLVVVRVVRVVVVQRQGGKNINGNDIIHTDLV